MFVRALFVFFVKQKTAYEMRISDWSSDVCSSDLLGVTYPEIYEMQARAIFEAALIIKQRSGEAPIPEIMIPLVATKKKLELMKAIVDSVAKQVFEEQIGRASCRERVGQYV